jgi:two-component system sensor kinase FixL
MAVAVLYVAVVLIAGNFLQRRGVLITAAACAVLTVLSYVLSHGGDHPTDSFVRCLMSLSAIGITTILVVKNQSAGTVLGEQARLLDLTHDTVFVRDMRDVITYWNSAAAEMYGWARDEAIGQVSHQLMRTVFPAAKSPQSCCEPVAGKVSSSTRAGPGGSSSWRAAGRCSGMGRGGRLRSWRPTTTSPSASVPKRHCTRQAELAHATRVATLGELAASIVHEVNQPIAAIVTTGDACLRWLGQKPPDLEEARDSVESMIRDSHRASEVIQRLRALAKKTDPQKAILDIQRGDQRGATLGGTRSAQPSRDRAERACERAASGAR